MGPAPPYLADFCRIVRTYALATFCAKQKKSCGIYSNEELLCNISSTTGCTVQQKVAAGNARGMDAIVNGLLYFAAHGTLGPTDDVGRRSLWQQRGGL